MPNPFTVSYFHWETQKSSERLGEAFLVSCHWRQNFLWFSILLTESCKIQYYRTQPCKVQYYRVEPFRFIIFAENIVWFSINGQNLSWFSIIWLNLSWFCACRKTLKGSANLLYIFQSTVRHSSDKSSFRILQSKILSS